MEVTQVGPGKAVLERSWFGGHQDAGRVCDSVIDANQLNRTL
jgi:hypothetical protein